MQIWKIVFACLLGVASFSGSVSWAQEFPADWEFVTLRTPHFDVIVNAKQQELGALYGRKLEKAFNRLTPFFTDVPERTTVVIADKTDLTNGYATRIPYPHIFVYPVLPGPQDSLGEAGDWIMELVSHEFTHLLTFEAVSGGAETLQSIFGTILSPNLLLPTWWKEGVAVHVETTVSQGGRLRSAYQDGVVRTFAADGILGTFDIAQINENLPDWPQGMRAYLFGSIFWSQAVAEKSPKVVDQLFQRHGRRVPYFIEAPAHDLLGMGYDSFYQTALADLEVRAKKQITKLKEAPLVEGQAWSLDAQYSQGPQISPDGERLAFIGVASTARRSIRLLRRKTPTSSFVDGVKEETFLNRREETIQPPQKDAPPTGSISRLSWMPDSQRLIFDKVDLVSRYETYSDLWVFDLQKQKAEQLTRRLRAREPFVAPDGKTIVFVGLDGARTWIGRWSFETQTAKEIWRADWQEKISFPVQMPDGSIIFALRNTEGWEGLRRLRPGETSPEVILDDFPDARFPQPSPKGLLFTSSKNGVHNLYLASADFLAAKPLTNTLGAIFSIGTDPRSDDLYLSAMSSHGPEIRYLAAKSSDRLPAELPHVDRIYADRYPKPAHDPEDPNVAITKEPYAPGTYLWPHYWIPFVGLSAVNNSVVIQASTSGFDPLQKHIYTLGAGWDAGVKEASYLGLYQNNIWSTSWSLEADRNVSYLVSNSTPLINETSALAITPDLFKVSRYFGASLNWQYRRTIYGSGSADRTGPSLIAHYLDYGRSGDQISPEEGGYLLGEATNYIPGGNRLNYTQYLLSGAFYWSRWLPTRNALAFKLNSIYTPDSLSATYGASTTNYFYSPDNPLPNYVVRGYRVGHFVGKTLNNVNLEYRFPLQEIHRGSGTDPIYLLRIHGAAFVDAVALDGLAYRPREDVFESVNSNQIFGSSGLELRVETTLGYFIPMNIIVGGAFPFSGTYSDGANLLTALQIGTAF